MPTAKELKRTTIARVDRIADELIAASDHLFHHPEIGYEEV